MKENWSQSHSSPNFRGSIRITFIRKVLMRWKFWKSKIMNAANRSNQTRTLRVVNRKLILNLCNLIKMILKNSLKSTRTKNQLLRATTQNLSPKAKSLKCATTKTKAIINESTKQSKRSCSRKICYLFQAEMSSPARFSGHPLSETWVSHNIL